MRAQGFGLDHRVAVFIDVENVLGWLKRGGCAELLRRARELGIVSIRRAFGDFSNPSVASRQLELQRCGFDLVHTLHPAKSKSNSADISMTIDVMESCREPDIQWVIMATGDSDFGPVFRRLREMGKLVVGVGPPSVLSNSVFTSCHEFILTDEPGNSRRRSRGGRGVWERYPGAGTGGSYRGMRPGVIPGTRLCYPPNALSIRGGFKMSHQLPPQGLIEAPPLRLDFAAPPVNGIGVTNGQRAAQPLLLEAPKTCDTSVPPTGMNSNGLGASGASGAIRCHAASMIASPSVGIVPARDSRDTVSSLAAGMIANSAGAAVGRTGVRRGRADGLQPTGVRGSPSTGSTGSSPQRGTGSPMEGTTGSPRADKASSPSVSVLGSRQGSTSGSPEGAAVGSPLAAMGGTLPVAASGSPPEAPAGPPPTDSPASDADRHSGMTLRRPGDVLLPPGQLLLPKMVTGAASTVAPTTTRVNNSTAAAAPTRTPEENKTTDRRGASSNFAGRYGQEKLGSCHYRPEERRQNGLGALSAVLPSEKLYRHLLALDSTSESGSGSLACDWGYGLSEMTLARGLVSLALACGAQQDSAHSRAVEALLGATRLRSPRGMTTAAAVTKLGTTVADVGDQPSTATGFSRQEACRIATLLQRCGFLSWLAEEQQWLVTVPADMEVLRRRRDDILMEELRTRCQEASVQFEPSLAVNLLWAAKRSRT